MVVVKIERAEEGLFERYVHAVFVTDGEGVKLTIVSLWRNRTGPMVSWVV